MIWRKLPAPLSLPMTLSYMGVLAAVDRGGDCDSAAGEQSERRHAGHVAAYPLGHGVLDAGAAEETDGAVMRNARRH